MRLVPLLLVIFVGHCLAKIDKSSGKISKGEKVGEFAGNYSLTDQVARSYSNHRYSSADPLGYHPYHSYVPVRKLKRDGGGGGGKGHSDKGGGFGGGGGEYAGGGGGPPIGGDPGSYNAAALVGISSAKGGIPPDSGGYGAPVDSGYGAPGNQGMTYMYQIYPSASNIMASSHGGGGGGWGWGEEEEEHDEGGGDFPKGLLGLLGLKGLKGVKAAKLLKKGAAIAPFLPIILPLLLPFILPLLLPILLPKLLLGLLKLALILFFPVPVFVPTGRNRDILARNGNSTSPPSPEINTISPYPSSTVLKEMTSSVLRSGECVEKTICQILRVGKFWKIQKEMEHMLENIKEAEEYKPQIMAAIKHSKADEGSCAKFKCNPIPEFINRWKYNYV